MTLKIRTSIINFVYANCKGNPMHIKEAIITLENYKCIKSVSSNSYLPVKKEYNEISISTLIDTINLRIAYYKRQWHFLVDMLIILSCVETGKYVYSYVERQFLDKDTDWKSILFESGFVSLADDNLSFLHENYKSAFFNRKVTNDNTIDRFLLWCSSQGLILTCGQKFNLQLRKKSVKYPDLYEEIISELNINPETRERYQLLQIIDSIYDYLHSSNVIPRYLLYKQLETATKEMGSWKKALEYNQKLKKEKIDTADYVIQCSHGRRNLANIYSFSMQWDQAVDEATEAIKDLEHFVNKGHFTPAESFELMRQLSLLYNRLSIVYQFSGN